jgi:conjugative transposon TraM protein
MKINFRQPKYVLPIILVPFLCLFFYAWHSGFGKPKQKAIEKNGLNNSVGEVSSAVKKKQLADKLDAYRNTFKEADGLSAVNIIPTSGAKSSSFQGSASDSAKRKLDSIRRLMGKRFRTTAPEHHDQVLAGQLNNLPQIRRSRPLVSPEPRDRDPMEMFKAQMAYMDSLGKENDPALKAEKLKKEAAEKLAALKLNEQRLSVTKAVDQPDGFNTVVPQKNGGFINAAIDEDVTGYAGSRLRLKLLDDIVAGNNVVKKGTYLYALVSGFSQQRVTLSVTTILSDGKILPVKLELYDLDGLPGLYVPSSAFRDFTKDLGSNSVQGVSLDGGSGGSQFFMSSASKLFQSTSSAIAELIRKNKAKFKYNSFIYLIDHDALLNAQNGEALLSTTEKNKDTKKR